jgi:UPF0042 nucleotide-binding protein
MEIVILTGMSGAGKSLAMNYLEDMGFFCIDNLPPLVLAHMVRTFTKSEGTEGTGIRRIAFVVDIRSLEMFSGILPALDEIEEMHVPYRIVFLEATDAVLIGRYKETRRNHPLAVGSGISQALQVERDRLEPLKEHATDVLDTSNMSPSDLRDALYKLLSEEGRESRMSILIQSFGFKYGIPIDCDDVIDVRFIPNPFYETDLKGLSGLDAAVREYVVSFPETMEFMSRLAGLFDYLIPYYMREGKVRLTIGIGCTGGRHRSVALALDLAERLGGKGLQVHVDHRDIDRDPRRRK